MQNVFSLQVIVIGIFIEIYLYNYSLFISGDSLMPNQKQKSLLLLFSQKSKVFCLNYEWYFSWKLFSQVFIWLPKMSNSEVMRNTRFFLEILHYFFLGSQRIVEGISRDYSQIIRKGLILSDVIRSFFPF